MTERFCIIGILWCEHSKAVGVWGRETLQPPGRLKVEDPHATLDYTYPFCTFKYTCRLQEARFWLRAFDKQC